jgi:hypothetical protein
MIKFFICTSELIVFRLPDKLCPIKIGFPKPVTITLFTSKTLFLTTIEPLPNILDLIFIGLFKEPFNSNLPSEYIVYFPKKIISVPSSIIILIFLII